MNPLLGSVLKSWYTRGAIALLGMALLAFYSILLIGAVVNLPVSWFGCLYAITGIGAGIACFVFAFRPRIILFFLIVPAMVLMLVTVLRAVIEK